MKEIKRLKSEDLDKILLLEKICFLTDSWRVDSWIDLLKEDRTYVFAIEKDGMLISSISIYNWKEDNYVKIMNVATHPDYRNKGYARKIMKHVIDAMMNEGKYIFKGETRVSNIAMQKLFEVFGYQQIIRAKDYYDKPKEDAYKYSLEIKKDV